MMDGLIYDIIGNMGVLCFLAAYFMLQKGTLQGDSYGYLTLNMAGAILHLISILHDWNLASFVLECAWVTITGYGFIKTYRKRKTA